MHSDSHSDSTGSKGPEKNSTHGASRGRPLQDSELSYLPSKLGKFAMFLESATLIFRQLSRVTGKRKKQSVAEAEGSSDPLNER